MAKSDRGRGTKVGGARMQRLSRKNFLKLGGAGLVGASLLSVAGCGGAGGQNGGGAATPIDATMAGASPTGHFRLVGESMNSIVRDEYPGSSIGYEPGSPAGSLANVANGRAEIAVAISPVEEKLANAGDPPFEESLEGEYMGIMQLHEQQLITAVMLESFAEEYGIEGFADIAEKQPPVRIVLNQTGNVQSTLVPEDIFAEAGFTLDDVEAWGGRIERGSSGDGAELLQDRQVDVWINPIFVPTSTIEEVAAGGVSLRWVRMDEEFLEPVAEKWDLSLATVEAGAYEFVTEEQPTIRYPSDVIANSDMPEDEVYRITKALYENTKEMHQIHPSLPDPEFGFSVENGVKVRNRIPLHSGAERYYKEEGAL